MKLLLLIPAAIASTREIYLPLSNETIAQIAPVSKLNFQGVWTWSNIGKSFRIMLRRNKSFPSSTEHLFDYYLPSIIFLGVIAFFALLLLIYSCFGKCCFPCMKRKPRGYKNAQRICSALFLLVSSIMIVLCVSSGLKGSATVQYSAELLSSSGVSLLLDLKGKLHSLPKIENEAIDYVTQVVNSTIEFALEHVTSIKDEIEEAANPIFGEIDQLQENVSALVSKGNEISAVISRIKKLIINYDESVIKLNLLQQKITDKYSFTDQSNTTYSLNLLNLNLGQGSINDLFGKSLSNISDQDPSSKFSSFPNWISIKDEIRYNLYENDIIGIAKEKISEGTNVYIEDAKKQIDSVLNGALITASDKLNSFLDLLTIISSGLLFLGNSQYIFTSGIFIVVLFQLCVMLLLLFNQKPKAVKSCTSSSVITLFWLSFFVRGILEFIYSAAIGDGMVLFIKCALPYFKKIVVLSR